MKISPKQLRFILLELLGLSVIVFLAAASMGLGKLSDQSRQLVQAKLDDMKADAQLTSLGKAKKEVEKYAYFNNVAKTVIPNDKDQAQAVLAIYAIAKQSGIALGTVSFPTSTLGLKSRTTSATGSGSAAAAITQAIPVLGISGLYSLELNITPQIGEFVPADKVTTYSKFLDFIGRLERNRRTAQITQINIQPQPQDASNTENAINFGLTVNIFIRPKK